MEVKVINRWLVLTLVVNALLMLSAIITLSLFRARIKEYKPTFPLSSEDIKESISRTTYNFLTNYHNEVAQKYANDSSNHFPVVKTADFCIYSIVRSRVLYKSAEYGINDFIDIDGLVLNILAIDFERQRFYAVDADARAYICVPSSAEPPAARRTDGGEGAQDMGANYSGTL